MTVELAFLEVSGQAIGIPRIRTSPVLTQDERSTVAQEIASIHIRCILGLTTLSKCACKHAIASGKLIIRACMSAALNPKCIMSQS